MRTESIGTHGTQVVDVKGTKAVLKRCKGGAGHRHSTIAYEAIGSKEPSATLIVASS